MPGPRCRVWILNHYADTPDRPTGTRHYSLGRAIVRHGGEVTIFAAGRSSWTGIEERVGGGAISRSGTFNGVRFVWVRTFPYRGNTWRRVVNMVSYGVIVCVVQFRHRAPDVVIGSTVHPFAALAGWVVAKLRNARFVYEVRDLWPQTLIDLGAITERSLGARSMAAIETFLVRRAETVLTVLPGMVAYLEGRGLPTDKVRYLPNGADLPPTGRSSRGTWSGVAEPLDSLLAEVRRRRTEGEVICAYIGSHGRVNRLEVVLRAQGIANTKATRPIRLFLVGDGPEKSALQRLAADLNIPNTTFADPIPKHRVPDFLEAIDVGVVHTTRNPVYRFGISFNKVFDYMAAGLPIAFACSTASDPVEAAGAGRSVVPDDPEALAEALVDLADMSSDERQRMGMSGRAFLEREHDMARLGDRFAEIIGCADGVGSDLPIGAMG